MACYQTAVNYFFPCNELVNKVNLFYRRFGHPHYDVLVHLLKNGQSINISTSIIKQAAHQICEACQMGKVHRLHFPATETKTSHILELIHTDL